MNNNNYGDNHLKEVQKYLLKDKNQSYSIIKL